MARTTSYKYDLSDLSNPLQHLTNHCIQAHAPQLSFFCVLRPFVGWRARAHAWSIKPGNTRRRGQLLGTHKKSQMRPPALNPRSLAVIIFSSFFSLTRGPRQLDRRRRRSLKSLKWATSSHSHSSTHMSLPPSLDKAGSRMWCLRCTP